MQPDVTIDVPHGKIADAVMHDARTAYAPFLLNHGLRTYRFARAIAASRGVAVDSELLFAAAVLHDIGLTERNAKGEPFHIAGADIAHALLERHGVPPDGLRAVWDAIAYHAHGPFARRAGVLAALLADATSYGVAGPDTTVVPPDASRSIVAEFPRERFKERFVQTCADFVRRFPDTAPRTFLDDIGREHVHGYVPADLCRAIADAPFDE